MAANDPIRLKLPEGFTVEDVKKAMDEEFTRKIHDAVKAGKTDIVINSVFGPKAESKE